MKSSYLFFGLLFCVLIIPAILLYAPTRFLWWIYVPALMALILLLLLWRSVLMPSLTVVKGMELIKAQDFNNRLRAVHETESDKIVELFNHMIDKLRNERLNNHEQNGFLKLLIDASPMGVAILDYDGKVVMMNESFIRLTKISDHKKEIGKNISELPSELVKKMLNVGLGENHIISLGDVKRYRCFHLSFIQNGFKRRFYLLESLTEEMMKAERAAYEKVIRIMSHEVNNTMGGVRSVLETLHTICEDDDLKEVIESCDNRCNQMCNFISSYADVVRVPEPVLRKVEINSMMKNMMPFLLGMVPEDIQLSFTPLAEDCKVSLDLALIQQVIVNIVKNAVESIKGTGHIGINLEKIGRRMTLTISNNGIPITEEVSRNLFSPFFTTKRTGRGLGLTLISEILNRHKANFSLTTDYDSITRFRITFN